MAAALRGTPTTVRGATPQTPTLPAGVVAGDWVYIFVNPRGGSAATCSTPAGWTALSGSPWASAGASATSDQAIFGFRRLYDGVWTLPSIAWGGDGGNNATVICAAFSGADGTTPDDVSPTGTSGAGASGGSAVLSPNTTLTANAFVFHLLAYNSGPTAMTVPDTTAVNNINRPSHAMGYSGVQAAAGSTGTRTYSWTGGASTSWVGVVLAIRPVSQTIHSLAATLQGVATMPADLRQKYTLGATLQGVATIPTAGLVSKRGLAALLQGVATVQATLTVPSTHGPEDYETDIGPLTSFTMKKRASIYVTVGSFPSKVLLTGSVMKASLYESRGAAAPARTALWRQSDILLTTARLDQWLSSGANPPASPNFPLGTPATLATEDGSPLLRSNGIPRMKAQTVGSITVPNDVFTALILANEVADTEGAYDPVTGIFVVPYTGQWLTMLKVTFLSGGAGTGYRQALAQVSTNSGGAWSGTAMGARIPAIPLASGVATDVIASGLMDRTAGNWVRLAVRHNDGGNLDIGAASYLAMVFMGPS